MNELIRKMVFIIRVRNLPRFFVLALIVSSCSVEIDQTTAVPSTPIIEILPTTSTTSLIPTTHIPVTWAHLYLTGKLVYTSSTMEGSTSIANIQILDLRTGDIAKIFSMAGAWIYYTTVSPDAKWLAISYAPPIQNDSTSNRTLYIMPLSAAESPQPLFAAPTLDDHYTQVEWSPEGKYIYFVHYNHNQSRGRFYEVYEIFRMNYPNGTPEKILDHALWPRLSSDSSKLVYVTLNPDTGENGLFLADADGSNSQRVPLSGPSTFEIIDAPIFAPDGQSILFSAPVPTQSYQPNWFEKLMGIQVAQAHNVPSDWWSVPITGGTPTQLTNIQTIGLFASISPDEKYIASVSGEVLFVMDLDGSNLTHLISDSGIHGTVSWIP
jgi:Tol biopolymer transport system component